MKEILIYAFLLGMTTASFITLVRAIPPGSGLTKSGKKPWACDICMSFWGIAGIGAIYFLKVVSVAPGPFLLYVCMPAYIICLWLIKQTKEIDFPEIEDKE